jgi:hypothetical protein
MGWRVAPGRYLKSGRVWIPQWRFQPLHELADAFQLLDRVADSFSVTSRSPKVVIANVKVGSRCGKASGAQIARTITIALARAMGLAAGE